MLSGSDGKCFRVKYFFAILGIEIHEALKSYIKVKLFKRRFINL